MFCVLISVDTVYNSVNNLNGCLVIVDKYFLFIHNNHKNLTRKAQKLPVAAFEEVLAAVVPAASCIPASAFIVTVSPTARVIH